MSSQQSSHFISLHEDGLYLLDLNKTTSLKLNVPFTLPARNEPVCILHCRGMMCLTLEGNNDLAIWNPASKYFRRIPMVEPGQTTNLIGFGYDRFSDDYKIVTIIGRKTYIYAFKKNSWRESVPLTALECKLKYRTSTAVDHCMYWIADRSHIKNFRKESTILRFDFANEEYQEMAYPLLIESNFSSWFGVLSGDLCLINHYPSFIPKKKHDPSLHNDICVWRPGRVDKKIEHWTCGPWIHMRKALEGFQSFDIGFACIARNDEVFIVVKSRGNGEDKVMVYNKGQEKFIEVPFGSSLKGFRCMSTYICQ